VVRSKADISNKDIEDLLILTYRLLDSKDPNDFNLCVAVICHVADRNFSDGMVHQLLHDNISKSRIFLYENLLKSRNEDYSPEFSVQDQLLQAFYTSGSTNTTLTKPQKEVFEEFQRHRRLIVSAPTSFGKTRIIREIIKHNNFKNIALIMPTVSLLSEQYRDMKEAIDGYVISKSSKIKIKHGERYILILTPERMTAFLDENPTFRFDFFVMDEIYKTDYKLGDDRFRVFSDILLNLAKSGSAFYLIGPYITDFSRRFRELFHVKMLKFDVEIVQKDYYFLDNIGLKGMHNIEGSRVKVVGDKFKNLTRITDNPNIDGKFLIYRYQKRYVEESAEKFSKTRSDVCCDDDLVSYLSKTVSPDWKLVSCIKKGVAFHHGAMPRHIQDLIVDEFNDSAGKGVDFLFCTTSLTEGINTSAKNVVLYDEKIGGGTPIGVLDRRNIEGRAGRFMKHFVGRVFHLEAYIEDSDDRVVEIESLDSTDPSIEAIIQFDDLMLSEAGHRKKAELKLAMEKAGLPFGIFKANKYVSISGQASLLKMLLGPGHLAQFAFDTPLPTGEIAKLILSNIYDHLFTENDIGRNFKDEIGKSILLQLTGYYLFYKPSFAEMLTHPTIAKSRPSIDSRIRYVFDIIAKYFEFIWPRYLMAFQNIYNYAAGIYDVSPIALELMIAQLEYGTTKNHEILLRDCGMPSESIRKISSFFADCESMDDVHRVKKNSLNRIKRVLDPIEIKIFDRYI
jgi:superfamily II DNA/RNA helicase